MTDAASRSVPRPASTVALLRGRPSGAEVLLTHRPPTMAFGPGIHVFPGGAVDDGDGAGELADRSVSDGLACTEAWGGDLEPAAALAHAVAAIRELYEEAGVLLASGAGGASPPASEVEAAHRSGEGLASLADRLDLRLRTDRLVPLSRWVTPPVGATRRYDARFYVADLADGIGFRLDDREVSAHAWLTPAAALDACRSGRIDLWPPTATTLRAIAAARDADDVRRSIVPAGPSRPPEVQDVGPGIRRIRSWDGGGIPGRRACGYLVGYRRLLMVDPGDPGEAVADAIRSAAASTGARLVAIVLTSSDPDALAGVTDLALRQAVPVLAASGVGRDAWEPITPLRDNELVGIGDVGVRVLAEEVGGSRLVLDVEVGGGEDRGHALVGSLFDDPVPPWRTHADPAAIAALRARVLALGPRRRLGARD